MQGKHDPTPPSPFEVLFDRAPIPLALSRLADGKIVAINDTALAYVGVDRTRAIGVSGIDIGFVLPGEQAQVVAAFRRDGRVRNLEVTRRSSTGQERVLLLSAEPVIAGGEPCVLGMIVDITAQRQAEAARQAGDREFEAVLDHVADGVAVYDVDGRIVRCNPSATALLDEIRQSMRRTDPGRDTHPWVTDDRDSIVSGEIPLERVLRGQTVGDTVVGLSSPSGVRRWVRVGAAPIRRAGIVTGTVATFTDVTDHHRAQVAALEREALLHTLVVHAPTAVAMFDREMRYLAWSQRYLDEHGLGTLDLHGRSHDEAFPEFSDRWRDIHARCLAGATERREEDLFQRANGTLSWLRWELTPWRDAAGEVGGLVLFSEDVTARRTLMADLRAREEEALKAKEALEQALEDTRRTEEKFRQSQKMEAVGRLAGGLAHDFNNLLTVILGNGSELLKSLPAGDIRHTDAAEIVQAGERAAALTQQLLAFSRQQVIRPRAINLNEQLQTIQRMLSRLLSEDIEIDFVLEPRLGACRLDPSQFEQVVLNLVVNARDAMSEGGRLTIETGNIVLDAAYAAEHPDVTPGPHVFVAISDTGHGMSAEVKRHLFEPFFTTKPTGKGTGLGLSMVYGIVRQNGGAIWVYSELTQGTTFKLYFPALDTTLSDPVPEAVPVGRLTGNETILLVEDDSQVRRTVGVLLRRAGYHVIDASNGGEALLVCEQHGGTIQLLVTDVVMPKLNGRQLSDRLRLIRPQLRVLFMSGYTENVVVHHGVLDSGLDFVQKPVNREMLLDAVRCVLDR